MTMSLLLDTHIFLWLVMDSPRLSGPARRLQESADAVFISSVSIWELAIKSRLGKIEADPDEMLLEIQRCGFQELPVTVRHAAGVARLPILHTDPFDTVLVAQAISEKMQLVTADAQLAAYADLVVVV